MHWEGSIERLAFIVCIFEWIFSCHEEMSDDSEAELIAFAVVGGVGGFVFAFVYFRGHVGEGSAFAELYFGFEVEGHAEVDDGGLHGVEVDNNVLGFDVSVYDFSFVAFLESFGDASEYGLDGVVGHVEAVVDDGQEVSALDKLGKEDELVVGFKESPIL